MPVRRRLTLREWLPTDEELDLADALALQQGPGEISVEAIGAARYRVAPSHFVGSISLPTVDVVIRPKVGVRRLFFLLGYAKGLAFRDEAVRLDESDDVTEAIVRAFLTQVRAALRRGPLMAYRSTDEAGPTIRGRVRLLDQARRRFSMPLPVEVTYDEFTSDIDENRVLKSALRRIRRLRLGDGDVLRRVGEILGVLESVEDVRYDSRTLPLIPLNRLNRHYEQPLALAELILSSVTADLAHGGTRMPSFMIDMDKVFEDFVFVALRERT